MGFLSPASLPLNKRVALEIELNSAGESVLVFGKVKWVRQLTGSELFRYGVKFSRLPMGTRSRISQYFSK